jgi:hypothetical protein
MLYDDDESAEPHRRDDINVYVRVVVQYVMYRHNE